MKIESPSKDRFDPASLQCAESLPVKMIDSSRDAGWTSLLLDYQQVLTAEEEFETVSTSDQTVVVMTRGEQQLEVRERSGWKRAVYRPGVIGLTPGGMTDRLRRRVDLRTERSVKINLYLPSTLFDEATDHLRIASRPVTIQHLTATAFVDETLRMATLALLRALKNGASDLYAEGFARWAAVHLLTFRSIDTRQDPAASASVEDKRLRRVLEFMEHHFASPLSLERLALEANVSKFHFTRLFQQATGITPHRWLSNRRLEAGRLLLVSSNYSIAEIALLCGYLRPNHFSTAFARKFGCTPTDSRLGC